MSSSKNTSINIGHRRRIERQSSKKLNGVVYDYFSKSFIAYIDELTGKRKLIGQYNNEQQASFAHDIEAFKLHGIEKAAEYINFSYDVEELNGNDYFSIIDSSGIRLRIPNKTQNKILDSAVSPSKTKEFHAHAPKVELSQLIATPHETSQLLTGKADTKRRWTDRTLSSFYPTATFAFDVIFPNVYASLGLQLRPHLLTYSIAGALKAVECCIVIDGTNSHTKVIEAGDIVLSVNGDVLLAESVMGETSHFDEFVKKISQAAPPRCVR